MVNLPRFYKQIIAASADAIFLPATFIVAIWLRYGYLDMHLLQHYAALIIAIPIITLPVYYQLGLYRAILRFVDQKIIYLIVTGISLSVLMLAFVSVMIHIGELSRSVFSMYWMGAILYMGSSRLLTRSYLLGLNRNPDTINIAIYGAGNAGVQLATALSNSEEYTCVAFIDDNKNLQNSSIAGIKVSAFAALPQLIAQHDIKEVLLALPSISRQKQKQILDQLEPLKLKIKVTPSIKSLVSGELRVQDVREIEIEDLLGRDAVEPDTRLLAVCIRDKNVMVTGAGGSIGSELCRQILRQQPRRLILLDISEYALYTIEQELEKYCQEQDLSCDILPFLGSVADREKVKRVLRSYQIHTVYHAAAYKHVPLVEHNPVEGIRNNVFGTLNLAQACVAEGVQNFVLISTDKAVRPTNVMGATKRLAELILQAHARIQHGTRFCMVRFGNVLGSSGSVVPLFRRQIMEGGPITLTHPEITRYFMTIPEAAQLVLQAGAMGEGGDVFVLDMGEPVKIIDLARRMVHLSGLEVKCETTPDGTIEIQHVGLRPGEKLFEELLIGDNVEGTSHPLIMRAQESDIPWDNLSAALQELELACTRFEHEKVRQLLLSLVREYNPQCGIEDWLWQSTPATTPSSTVLH
jgi:FlaA1/EpsC-like NDP-sugar epimerase